MSHFKKLRAGPALAICVRGLADLDCAGDVLLAVHVARPLSPTPRERASQLCRHWSKTLV